ncbi:MAG TPA: hypothetical protein PK971_11875, partial [Saprospiraceae bacterium]|nr:hypothetical protein [Saprospiraceae bacterium]
MNISTHYSMALLCSLLCLTPIAAQTFQIGDADGVNSQAQFPCPYGDLYEGMRAQYLYTADEMTAKGATAGFISTVGFLVADPNNAALENFSIRLSNTGTTSLSNTTWEAAGTLCYSVGLWQTIGGQNLHLLQNQFYWDGTSNLLVEGCFNPADPASGDFATTNARVAWSRNLPFNGSHTFAADDEMDICATNTTASIGFEDNRPVLLLRFSCEPPTNLTLTSLSSTSASVQFTASPDANTYVWELGLAGFSPGTNTALFSGVTPNTTLTFTNLDALTLYDVYVRSNCGSTNSTWVGPFSFKTLAGCGDAYYDSGGFLGAYQDNESRVEVLCPDSANHVMTIEFAAIALAAGDTLRVYNGNGLTWPLMATFTGTAVSIPPLSATTASGCLTVQFNSDTAQINVGWLADLSCARPDSCFNVLEPTAYPVFPFYDRMGVRWRPTFDAKEYQWRAGVRPYLPSQPTALKDT